jgi:NAD(P)-dependent dehydrogenase (short-subunit alcohol dehydrogenase family)
MRKRGCGSIVINASINGIRGNQGMVAYAASKGGAVALTRALAMDHAAENIRVNCLCPGTIRTRMIEHYLAEVGNPAETEQRMIAKHPLGRLGRAEEVAYAALFLASDEASFITGVVLPVDGGRHIR